MYRMIRTVLQNYRHTAEQVRIMIIGAGEATNVLMREIQNSRYMDNSKVVCIIDDDTQKVGKYIRGVKVVGTRNKIKEVAKVYDIDEIIFAIPSASMEDKRNILNICKETDCNLKILPGVYQMVDGEINVNSIRSVDVWICSAVTRLKSIWIPLWGMLKIRQYLSPAAAGLSVRSFADSL